jgi:hypothetical protein
MSHDFLLADVSDQVACEIDADREHRARRTGDGVAIDPVSR